ncbi:MAG: TrkH family potassium uptake protein [Bacteroidota bacterium]
MRYFRHHLVLHVIGITLLAESLFLILALPVSLIYHDHAFLPFLWSILITAFVGGLLYLSSGKGEMQELSMKESFMIVTFSWVAISLFGSLPYIFSRSIPGFINAFFETVSGFTTTGSSVLADIEALPKSILFWRSMTHWIGGMGIIFLVIAILPFFKVGGTNLFSAEGSLLGVDKIQPRLIDVAKRLLGIYLLLTFLETVLLKVVGMTFFDALCHSFGTIATGGFSTKNTSLIDYSPLVQYIVIVFMALSGMNFTLHYMALHGQFRRVFRNEEWRAYLLILILVTGALTFVNRSFYHGNIETSMRHSLFQVVSIITATGFASADYEQWPGFAIQILFMIMFIGACVGSTGGGIKIGRYVIVFKNFRNRIMRMLSPNAVRSVRYNGEIIGNETIQSVFALFFAYFGVFLVGTIIMMLTGLDAPSASSSVITTLGGIGPGLGVVGPVDNFMSISAFGKIYLSFNMILGRLEIFTVMALFSSWVYKA